MKKPDPIKRLAARIVADLFTNGFNETAAHLVMEGAGGRRLGGWSDVAVRQRIEKRLRYFMRGRLPKSQ